MKKVVLKHEVETVDLNNIDNNKLLVGILKEGRHLVFSQYITNGRYFGLTTPYCGFIGNWSTTNDIRLTTRKQLYKYMFEKCSHLYQVDSWEDVAEIIKIHKPVLQ